MIWSQLVICLLRFACSDIDFSWSNGNFEYRFLCDLPGHYFNFICLGVLVLPDKICRISLASVHSSVFDLRISVVTPTIVRFLVYSCTAVAVRPEGIFPTGGFL